MNTRILLIEDTTALRNLIALLLETAGHTVTVAEHGRAAIALLDRERFDLIVTDLLMPEQDGVETIVQVRRRDTVLPILAITGGGQLGADYYLSVAKHLGATGLLKKPFTRDELLERVTALLQPLQPV